MLERIDRALALVYDTGEAEIYKTLQCLLKSHDGHAERQKEGGADIMSDGRSNVRTDKPLLMR